MAKISANAIIELLKLAIQYGAPLLEAKAVLEKHGVDPEIYRDVIDDRRTFEDFHKAGEPSPEPVPEPEPPAEAPEDRYGSKITYDSDPRFDAEVASRYRTGDVVFRTDDGKFFVERGGVGIGTPDGAKRIGYFG